MVTSDLTQQRVNGQRTALPVEGQSELRIGDGLQDAMPSPSFGGNGASHQDTPSAANLELIEAKQLVGNNCRDQYLWKVGIEGDDHVPCRWVKAERNLVRHLEDGWLPYGWSGVSNGHRKEVIRRLADQARKVRPRLVFETPGWHRDQEQWIFVHAGGRLAAGGPVPSVEAMLPPPFDVYRLPTPSPILADRNGQPWMPADQTRRRPWLFSGRRR